MNAELYGGPDPPSPATILDYRRTKRPPPFERLAAVRLFRVANALLFCGTIMRQGAKGQSFL